MKKKQQSNKIVKISGFDLKGWQSVERLVKELAKIERETKRLVKYV